MSYDNSQVARVFLHAWQVTGNEFFRTITEEILDYVVREMVDPTGGFYSTQDADSEGEEGKFFVWTPGEIREVLGRDAHEFMTAYGVTQHGNFEGKNILEFVGDMNQRATLAEARRKLFEAREQRVHPGRDEKVLTSWNGLMLAAFAEAARAFSPSPGIARGRRGVRAGIYHQVAERNADFLLRELRQVNGHLLRTWKASPEGTFYDTSDDHETLITRPRDLQDNATPSRNAMAVTALLKLAGFTNDMRYVDIAHQALVQMQSMLAQYPLDFGQWLQALAFALSQPREIAIVGDPEATGTQAVLNVVRDGYRSIQVVALGAPGAQLPAIPLLQDRRPVDAQVTAYVCRGSACKAPVAEPEQLQVQMEPRFRRLPQFSR